MKSRRKPPRTLSLPRLVAPLGLGAALALSITGFIYFTRITLDKQAHFAPEAAHPWDGYAALCLFCGMVSLAGLLLGLRDPAPMRWRRGRASQGVLGSRGKQRQAKRRQSSGTIPKQ